MTKRKELNITWISPAILHRPTDHYRLEIIISKSTGEPHKRQFLKISVSTSRNFHVMKDFDEMAAYTIRVRPENAVGRNKFSAPLQIHRRQAPTPSGGLPPWAIALTVVLVLLFCCTCLCYWYYFLLAVCLIKHRKEKRKNSDVIYYQPGNSQVLIKEHKLARNIIHVYNSHGIVTQITYKIIIEF